MGMERLFFPLPVTSRRRTPAGPPSKRRPGPPPRLPESQWNSGGDSFQLEGCFRSSDPVPPRLLRSRLMIVLAVWPSWPLGVVGILRPSR